MASFFCPDQKETAMDKKKKNRSGSMSNGNSDVDKNGGERLQTTQPGAPNKSNRQTGGHRKDESHGSDSNTTKKGPTSI